MPAVMAERDTSRASWTRSRSCGAGPAAVPISPLLQLVEVVLLHAIRRVGHDGVKRVLGHPSPPLQAIGVNVLGFAAAGGFVGECEGEHGVHPPGDERWCILFLSTGRSPTPKSRE